jgi:ubiquinone/menaquinone biosynthesis C-methylase UbiE
MNNDFNWDIFFDIHKDLPRQGSGRDKYTEKAFNIIPTIKNPKILDIGCGPGLQTIHLAKISSGKIIGIDIHQPYLDQLEKLIQKEKLSNKITTDNKSMFNMDFQKNYFDIIWAEGSIFIIGFERGLMEWKQYLKPKGFLVVHEMTWLKHNPPKEIIDYWKKVYPDINTIEFNLKIIKKSGYNIIGFFPLPEDAWWDFYYEPLEKRLKKMRVKYKNNKKAQEMINIEQEEIDLFRRYSSWYGSVFFVMQKN